MSTPVDPNFPFIYKTTPVHVEDQPVHTTGGLPGPVSVVAPANSNAGSDTAITFGATANHLLIQNNTGSAFNYDLDQAATPGSMQLPPSQVIFLDITTTTLHIRTAAAQPINGSVGSNIVVRAWT